ncbi:hypothetical protein GCM10011518_37010 [Flavobacterium limi]|uniref:Uncharacterized protein n=1 Tax=Flavobacterium limi TaxID=2045105 RepID=A0ABQ1UQQ9_9FLAO|nr:hypothetical protein GCM10011518_37010 [Flavobacterium limi]
MPRSIIKKIEKKYSEGFYDSELFMLIKKLNLLILKQIYPVFRQSMLEKLKSIFFERIDVEFEFLGNP